MKNFFGIIVLLFVTNACAMKTYIKKIPNVIIDSSDWKFTNTEVNVVDTPKLWSIMEPEDSRDRFRKWLGCSSIFWRGIVKVVIKYDIGSYERFDPITNMYQDMGGIYAYSVTGLTVVSPLYTPPKDNFVHPRRMDDISIHRHLGSGYTFEVQVLNDVVDIDNLNKVFGVRLIIHYTDVFSTWSEKREELIILNPRQCLGGAHAVAIPKTPSPTSQPTNKPTTARPTSKPTTKRPTMPSRPPTNSPTFKPTKLADSCMKWGLDKCRFQKACILEGTLCMNRVRPSNYDLRAKIVDYCQNGETFDFMYFPNWYKIENWDVSHMTSFLHAFTMIQNCRRPLKIENWNTSRVTSMEHAFSHSNINPDISKWDVSRVVSMRRMFYSARGFNQNLSSWNISKVDNMFEMFRSATKFDQRLCWDVSYKDIDNMFFGSRGSLCV